MSENARSRQECELTGLEASMCAHCLGHTEHPKPRATGPTINAHYDGTCTCGCDKRFVAGASITYSGEAGGWVITEHTEEGS